jgi:sec-independent protein translocase protein TatA
MGLENIHMLAGLSTWHIVALLVIVVLLFGGKKLPELARGVGKGLRIFRDEMHGITRDIEEPPTRPNAQDKPDAPTDATEKKA